MPQCYNSHSHGRCHHHPHHGCHHCHHHHRHWMVGWACAVVVGGFGANLWRQLVTQGRQEEPYPHHHHDSTDNDSDNDDVNESADDYNTGRQKLFHLEHGAVLSIEIAANHHSNLDLKVGSASQLTWVGLGNLIRATISIFSSDLNYASGTVSHSYNVLKPIFSILNLILLSDLHNMFSSSNLLWNIFPIFPFIAHDIISNQKTVSLNEFYTLPFICASEWWRYYRTNSCCWVGSSQISVQNGEVISGTVSRVLNLLSFLFLNSAGFNQT